MPESPDWPRLDSCGIPRRYLDEDDGEEQVEEVFGSVVVLPWRSPAPPAAGEQHPPLPSLLLLLGRRRGRGGVGGGSGKAGGVEPFKGEDFWAALHWGPRQRPQPP